jgi:hypothetical protein
MLLLHPLLMLLHLLLLLLDLLKLNKDLKMKMMMRTMMKTEEDLEDLEEN